MNTVEQYRADADQAAALDITTVQRDTMSDRYPVLENGGVRVRADVYYRPVLNVRPVSDPDKIYVAAYHRAEPNARVLSDLDIADYCGIISNESCRGDLGVNVVVWSYHCFFTQRRKERKEGKEGNEEPKLSAEFPSDHPGQLFELVNAE